MAMSTRQCTSYLGTYAEDRQAALEALFVEPARRRPHGRFVIGGAQYPTDFPWAQNIFFVRHLPPAEPTTSFGWGVHAWPGLMTPTNGWIL